MPKSKSKGRIIPPEDMLQIQAISAKIKQLRINTGLSYEAFAGKNGLHRITYYKLESGKQNFTMATFLKTLRGLGMTQSEFCRALEDPKR
jgi:transcriptional regulator with XRE-family HTH domain